MNFSVLEGITQIIEEIYKDKEEVTGIEAAEVILKNRDKVSQMAMTCRKSAAYETGHKALNAFMAHMEEHNDCAKSRISDLFVHMADRIDKSPTIMHAFATIDLCLPALDNLINEYHKALN